MKKTWYCLIFISFLLTTSCMGAAADIVLRADGSGSITLEYRVSQMLESMGRLDGNERRPAIPVGRADFERSIARLPGLRLSEFSVKEAPNALRGDRFGSSGDVVTRVRLDFTEIDALIAFLDSAGSRASLVQADGKSALRLILREKETGAINGDLLSLMRDVSAGYELSVSFTAPKEASLSVTPPSVPAARLVSRGKKVSFAIGMGDLLAQKDGLTLEISWQ